jgi:hypothetical protein
VRHRLNVMQGGASMAPPVARCSNGPTPCRRIFARVGSPMFLRARVAFAGAHLCQESASGARAFARVLRGFERIDRFADEHGYGRASFSTPQSGKWNWPERVVKIVGSPRFGPVSCLAALAPVTRRFLVLPLVWPR